MNFFKQAYEGKTDWWRFLIILCIFFTPFLKGFLNEILTQFLSNPFQSKEKNLYIALNLSVYIFLLGIFVVVFKLLHRRSILSLITARKKFDWMRFWFSFGSWGALLMIMLLSSVFYSPEKFEWNFKPIAFLNFFLICVALMPFQVLFKVILIRGYLLQTLITLVKKPWISLVITIIFYTIFMYFSNKKMVTLAGNEIFIRYMATSFFIGFIIILDDGIEIILGMSLISSLLSALFVTSKKLSFQPDSILIKDGDINVFILVYATVFLLYPLYFYFLKKMYGWNNWKEKLFSKVNNPNS